MHSWEDCPLVRIADTEWSHMWETDYSSYVPWHDLPRVADDRISVHNKAVYLGDGKLASNDPAEPIMEMLADMPPVSHEPQQTGTKKAKAPPRAAWVLALIEKYPWYEAIIEEEERQELKAAKASKGGSSEDNDDDESTPKDTDQDFEDMIAEYQRARDELDAGLPAGSKFRVKVLGGTWTSRNKHVGYDAYRGEPINAVAEAWGVQYTMGRSARFAISLYTERGAAMLARVYAETCHY